MYLPSDISVGIFVDKQNSPAPFFLQNAFFPQKSVSFPKPSSTRPPATPGDNQQVYVPVDLQKAWASLHGLPVDPTALEGITQLQGWMGIFGPHETSCWKVYRSANFPGKCTAGSH